jgi:hypothetical protein
MAHYAFLSENNIVTEVISGKDESNYDWEQHYGAFRGQACKRTSYNTHGGVHSNGGTPFRKNFASVGHIYDPNRDAFIPPKPYSSWILDDATCLWNAPIAKPEGGYAWNEETLSWIEIESN